MEGHGGVGGAVLAPGRPRRVLLSYTSSEKETEVAGGKHAVVNLMGFGSHTKPACPNVFLLCETSTLWGFPGGSYGKEFVYSAGGVGSIPG